MKIKRAWSDNAEVQKRFDDLNNRINMTLSKLPDLELMHEPEKLHVYDLKMLAYLEEYKKDLDSKRALATLGIAAKTLKEWEQQSHFVGVVNKINDAYAEAVLMDRKTIAGWSVEILRDIHNRFKQGDTKVAPALASMAGNMLRASGNFGETDGAKQSQILIQINTNSPQMPVKKEKKDEVKTITAEPSTSINLKAKNNANIIDMSLL